MKKLLAKVLCGIMVACLAFSTLTACSPVAGGWKAGSLINPDFTNGVKNYGFVAETDNYVYAINGVAVSSQDNTFGAPVKGSLVVSDKSDLTKSEIVVPKLFTSTDYQSGFWITADGYVYYGTSNLEKNSSGKPATDEMVFARTKLDGSGATEILLKVGNHSTEYAIAEDAEGVVYIVYYNATESALVSFNCATKESLVIAKTDEKAKTLSLDSYKLLKKSGNACSVIYTVTVYSEDYNEEKASKEGYVRPTESYNQMYVYTFGDKKVDGSEVVGTLVLNGEKTQDRDEATYAFKHVDGNSLYYTETINTKAKTYGVKVSDLVAQTATKTLIVNDSYLATTNIIVSLGEVYVLDGGVVYKTTLTEKDGAVKEKVVICDTISTMISIVELADGKYITYFNSSNELAMIRIYDSTNPTADEPVEIIVSSGVINVSWFKPVIIEVDSKDYAVYCSANSFLEIADLTAEVKAKDTDDDDKDDKFFLESAKDFGVLTAKAKADKFTTKIDALSSDLENGVLVMKEVDGALTVKAVTEVKELIDGITDSEVKGLISEDSLKALDNYVTAIKYANVYNKLKGIESCPTKEDATSFEAIYNEIKAEILAFEKSDNVVTIKGYIDNNLEYYFQHAEELFEAEEE